MRSGVRVPARPPNSSVRWHRLDACQFGTLARALPLRMWLPVYFAIALPESAANLIKIRQPSARQLNRLGTKQPCKIFSLEMLVEDARGRGTDQAGPEVRK